MTHARTTIGENVQAVFIDATTAGSTVYLNRLRSIPGKDLPALNINTGPEQVTESARTDAGIRQERVMQTTVICRVQEPDDFAVLAENLAQEVEDTILTASIEGVQHIELNGLTPIHDDSGDTTISEMVVSLNLTYHTLKGSAGTALA